MGGGTCTRDSNAGFSGPDGEGGRRTERRNRRAPQDERAGPVKAQRELPRLGIDQNPASVSRGPGQTHETCIDLCLGDRRLERIGGVHHACQRGQDGAIRDQIRPVERDDLEIVIIIDIDREDALHTAGGLGAQRPSFLARRCIARQKSAGADQHRAAKIGIDQAKKRGEGSRGRCIECGTVDRPRLKCFCLKRLLDRIIELRCGEAAKSCAWNDFLGRLASDGGKQEVARDRDLRHPRNRGGSIAFDLIEGERESDADRGTCGGRERSTDGRSKASCLDCGIVFCADRQISCCQALILTGNFGSDIHEDVVDRDGPANTDAFAGLGGGTDPDRQGGEIGIDPCARKRGDGDIAGGVDRAVLDKRVNFCLIPDPVEPLPERAVLILLQGKIRGNDGWAQIFIDPPDQGALIYPDFLTRDQGPDFAWEIRAQMIGCACAGAVPADFVDGKGEPRADGGRIGSGTHGHRGRGRAHQRRDRGSICGGDRKVIGTSDRARGKARVCAAGDRIDGDRTCTADGDCGAGACGHADGGGGHGGIDEAGADGTDGDILRSGWIKAGKDALSGGEDRAVFCPHEVAGHGDANGNAFVITGEPCPYGDGGRLDIGEDPGGLIGADGDGPCGLDCPGGGAEARLGGGAHAVQRQCACNGDGV